MRITDWLRADHRRFRRDVQLLDAALSDPKGGRSVREALGRLLQRLRVHEQVEDQQLFPAVAAKVKGMDPETVEVFTDAHEELHGKVADLEEALSWEKAPLSRLVAASNFTYLLLEHMKEEEEILFPIVERSLPAALQEALAAGAEQLAQAAAPLERTPER